MRSVINHCLLEEVYPHVEPFQVKASWEDITALSQHKVATGSLWINTMLGQAVLFNHPL